jgi:hypothetical protein
VNPKRPKLEPIGNPSLFEMEKLHKAAELTANGWEGSFYPRGMQSRDFLSYYAS